MRRMLGNQDRKRVGKIGRQEEWQKIREQNEIKKEYLWGYRRYRRQAERLEGQLEELRLGQMPPCVTLSDMPGARCRKDLSDYVARLEELTERIIKARKNAVEKFSEAQGQIERMEDENEKTVLTLRYLRDYSWEKVYKEMNYRYQHIHRIHAKALKNFKIKKDVIE